MAYFRFCILSAQASAQDSKGTTIVTSKRQIHALEDEGKQELGRSSARLGFGTGRFPTPTPFAQQLGFHAEICKEFYQAPVLIHIPRCCHTFCSACIRTCFNNDSNNQKIRATGLGGVGNSHRCPVCKVEAQEEKIKPVPTLESAVVCWQEAREEILNMINRLHSFETQPEPQMQPDLHPASVPQPSTSSSISSNRPQTRSTRAAVKSLNHSTRQASPEEQAPPFFRSNRLDSKASKMKTSAPKKRKLTGQSVGPEGSDDSIQLLSYNPTDPSAPVQCPICQKQMLNSSMDLHLTRCLNENSKSSKSSGKRTKKNSPKDQDQEGTKPNQTRIPLPHFSSLKPKEVKAELIRHDLNLEGTTSDQIRRLSKYITLFNANLDAQPMHQKSIESVKSQVYLWEGLQDSENVKLDQRHKKLLNNQQDYLKKHKSHFDTLIDQASKSLKKATSNTISSTSQEPVLVDDCDQQPEKEKGTVEVGSSNIPTAEKSTANTILSPTQTPLGVNENDQRPRKEKEEEGTVNNEDDDVEVGSTKTPINNNDKPKKCTVANDDGGGTNGQVLVDSKHSSSPIDDNIDKEVKLD